MNSCTRSRANLPDERKYAAEASLLYKSAQKLADESDVKKLNEIALAMQTTRTLACIDYNNECTLFGKYLSLIIVKTKKGSLTPEERKEIQTRSAEVRTAVEEGMRKLKIDWAARKATH